jgi:hypothetical protein
MNEFFIIPRLGRQGKNENNWIIIVLVPALRVRTHKVNALRFFRLNGTNKIRR